MSERRRMRGRPRWWLAAAQAVVLLPLVRFMLWTRGYSRTMRWLASTTSSPVDNTEAPATSDAVLHIASAVTTVARLAPFRSRCLARSMTIWWVCRRHQYAVDLLIGVAPPDALRLPAHAWVEYGGVPVNDAADVRARYAVLPMPTW